MVYPHLPMTSRTCSLTDKSLVTVTPRILMCVTQWYQATTVDLEPAFAVPEDDLMDFALTHPVLNTLTLIDFHL